MLIGVVYHLIQEIFMQNIEMYLKTLDWPQYDLYDASSFDKIVSQTSVAWLLCEWREQLYQSGSIGFLDTEEHWPQLSKPVTIHCSNTLHVFL